MREVLTSTLLICSALFPIVNPLGGSPIFLALTPGYTSSERRRLAWRVALDSFILLVVSFLIGTHILAFFGISIPVVQVAGGLVVISNGWVLLKQKQDDARGSAVNQSVDPADLYTKAFYPLTMPITVGPGSISVAITLGANEPRHLGWNLLAIFAPVVGSFLIALSILLCYGFADRLARLLGATGMSVILRLSSFILVCIGVEIMWNGIRALLASLPAIAR